MSKIFIINSILMVVLTLASLIGYFINKNTPIDHLKKNTRVNLVERINSWWVMIILLMLVFELGFHTTVIFFGILSFLSLREFITLNNTVKEDHYTLSLAFFIILPLQYILLYTSWYGLFTIFIPVYCFLLLPFFSIIQQNTQNFLERIAKIQFGIMMTIYCISYIPALLTLKIHHFSNNYLLLYYLIIVVQMSDVLQYVFGKLFGKHKIAPIVSPSKTWEGFVGGTISSGFIGGFLYSLTPFSFAQSFLFSSIIVLLGFLGGLVLSAIKRSLGAKDWGDMIQGHGGVLDRLDSLVFAAPIFFHLIRYFYT